ncbi:MAG: hypothetical protein DRH57_03015 [Candidatus Cloacimonadota bacterium]|nr:MAG: hypothetical protein DRH57_03015 [Candidatus Cloacimonadota bacterium]
MSNSLERRKKHGFSLLELLMVIMIVGIIMTIVIPMYSSKIKQERLKEAITTIAKIRQKNVEFKKENGYFAFDISQLNMQLDSKYFVYAVTDSTIEATTTKEFGKEGAKVVYCLPNGPWKTSGEKNIIDTAWLP